MNKKIHQMNTWSSDFGKDYTDRNPHNPEEMNKLYEALYGVTRRELNVDFLGSMDKDIRILEVGANVGTQLQALQSLGFTNLYGVELQAYAVEEAKKMTRNINIIQASAFDLPFKDEYFDMVYTSGVLIHINPDDIDKAFSEMNRVSKRYIWGFEYFDETYQAVPYRGQDNLLWKADFGGEIITRHPAFSCIQKRDVPYINGRNVDQMYLLEK